MNESNATIGCEGEQGATVESLYSVPCLETMMLVGLWFMRVSDWRMPDSGDAVYFDCAFSESICLK